MAALVGGGLGLPLPEDLVLLAAGFLVWRGDVGFAQLAPLALIAIVLSDFILYGIGRYASTHPAVARLLKRPRALRLAGAFRRNDLGLVLLARVAVGARAGFFLAAGMSRMRLVRFLVVDALGGAAMVTLWMHVGAALGEHIERWRPILHAAAGALVAMIVVIVLWRIRALLRTVEKTPEVDEL